MNENRAVPQNLDDGLERLIKRGFLFQHLKGDNGLVTGVIGSYAHPDTEYWDQLQLFGHGDDDAFAARSVVSDRPGQDPMVWKYHGDPLGTIVALLQLPAPYEPGAPRLARRPHSSIWQPGIGNP